MNGADFDTVKMLINESEENENVDFKAEMYRKPFDGFVKDVLSFANAAGDEPKYIIVGVKDIPGKPRDVLGISNADIVDPAILQNIVREKVEPHLIFSFVIMEYEEKNIGYLKIQPPFNRPYILKNDLKEVKAGDSFIRVNSVQKKLLRRDYDEIYEKKAEWRSLRLAKLSEKRREVRKELLLIYLLKSNLHQYIIEKDCLFQNIKSFIQACEYSPRRMTEQEVNQHLEELRGKILSFSVYQPDIKSLFELLSDCDSTYYSQYAQIIEEIQSAYQKLKNCQQRLQEIHSAARKEPSDPWGRGIMGSIWRKELMEIPYIHICNYFPETRGDAFGNGFFPIGLKFDANQRIVELQKALDRVQAEYDGCLADYTG